MKARIIALYLPQFHPIPENDECWGPGFTEWTNVAKAKPLYKGHVQPKIPADLGFYDLRMPVVREQQAQLAREAGVEGFCYYHYWFGGGRQLLERPFEEVLASGKPDYPFCICWANHTWSNKTWEKGRAMSKPHIIAEQTYPGKEDDIAHFKYLLPAFKDHRYIKVDGKPMFTIYGPIDIPHMKEFIETWQQLARENGLPGIYFVGMTPSTRTYHINPDGSHTRCLPNTDSSEEIFNDILSYGFDAVNSLGMRRGEMLYEGKIASIVKKVVRNCGINLAGVKYDYAKTVCNFFAPEDKWENVFPTIVPQWDRSPRVGIAEGVYANATPEKFREHIKQALSLVEHKSEEHRIIFLKSWNEWGEGNYVEPDLQFGHGWLDAIKDTIK